MHLTSIGYLLFFAAWGWLFASFVELIAHFNPSIELSADVAAPRTCVHRRRGAERGKLFGRWQNASMWSRMGRQATVLSSGSDLGRR